MRASAPCVLLHSGQFSDSSVSPATASVPAQVPARGEIDLRPKWRAGKADRYMLSIDANARLEPGAGLDPMVTKDKREVEFRLVCVSADEAGADVAMVVDRFSGSGTHADGTDWEYDSADSSKSAVGAGLPPMLEGITGSVIRLRFDAMGQIESVSGGQGLLAALPGAGAGEPGQAFGSLIGVNQGKASARVGDRWTTASTLDAGPLGSLELTTDSTLRSVKGGAAQIEVNGRVSQSSKAGAAMPAGIELGDCTHRGKYSFDVEAGRIREYTTEMDMRATLSLGGTTAQRHWSANVRCRHLGEGSTVLPNAGAR